MSETTSLSLLERLRAAPEESDWRDLEGIYAPLIRRWVLRQGPSGADADDLVQEILLVVVREVEGFEHSRRAGAFRAWLRAIAANRLKGYWRSRRQGPDPAALRDLERLEDPRSDLARSWDLEHDRHVVRTLLERIAPEFSAATWGAFRRQVIDGLPAAEVAAERGLSVNAVLIAKSRVLRRLRQEGRGLIGDDEAAPDGVAAGRPEAGEMSRF